MVAVAATGGVAAALVATASGGEIKGCLDPNEGTVRELGGAQGCLKGEIPVEVGRKSGTLTINGVAFKGSRSNKTITINGNSFRTGTLPNSLTINGNSFRTGTLPNSLTINGNSFRTGTLPNSLTINGVDFQDSGNVLTIAGTEFGPGAAAGQGPAGPQGPQGERGEKGEQGIPGTLPSGPAPDTPAAEAITTGPNPTEIASQTFRNSDGEAHRLLLTGGFHATCAGIGTDCDQQVRLTWDVRNNGAANALTGRYAGTLDPLNVPDTEVGVSFSEIVVMPDVCGPCTLSLGLTAISAGAGGPAETVPVDEVRFGLVDLGPVE